MKQILFLLLTSGFLLPLYGQGTFQISGATVKTTGGAYIVLDNMHLVNNGNLQQASGDGSIKFTSSSEVNLSGSGTTTIDSLLLAKGSSSKLNLQTNIGVVSKLDFQGGILDLGNNNIDLGNTGVLTSESENSRTFTSGSGYIQQTNTLNAPSSLNPGNLGAVISTTANLGTTTIRRGHAVQQVAPGTYSIQRYYDIIPTNNATLNATLRFQYFDAELNGLPESSLSMWRGSGSSWTNIGVNTRDVTANFVEKRNVQSFGRMTLAAGCSMTAAINDVWAVNPGGAEGTLYIGYGPTSLTLSATVSGGTTPYTYRWTQGSPGGTVLGTKSTLTVSPTTLTTYYLSVSDAAGCSAPAASKTINVVDVRCGTKLSLVTVCILQKGSYFTQCVASSKVKGYLSAGGYLGACLPGAGSGGENTTGTLTVSVIPNPAPYYFTLLINSQSDEPVTVRVVDATGRLIEVLQDVAPNRSINIGANYRPGLYHAEVIQGNQRVVVKMIKSGL